MNQEIITNNILKARENRAKIRKGFAKRDFSTLSLTFNIPGCPKHNQLIDKCFDDLLKDLKIYLLANRIFTEKEEYFDEVDEAGRLFIIALKDNSNIKDIKLKTEDFEHTHQLGRIIDVDIFDTKAKPVSSGKVKPCVICGDKPAIVCMREQNHTYEELRNHIFDKIWKYNFEIRNENIKQKLSEIAAKSILMEVSLSPKPGLVDFNNSGAHNDMDFNTFVASSAAISQFWNEFAEAGLNFSDKPEKALPIVRQIGIKAEKAMFQATGNVNTQKGLIFLLGLSIFSSAYLLKYSDNFDEVSFIETLKTITKNLVKNELNNTTEKNTHGENTFQKYGLKGAGARFQAEHGFSIVFDEILPFLRRNYLQTKRKSESDEILKTALLKIIHKLDDSNVLHRKGLIVAEDLKKMANKVLKEKLSYQKFCDFCINENISPGGAADMLAVSLFFYYLELIF